MSTDCIHIWRTTCAADRYIIPFFFSVIYTYSNMYTPTCMKLNAYMQSYIYNISIHIFTMIPHTHTYIYIYIQYIYSHHISYHIYPLKKRRFFLPHWDSPSPGDELRSNLVRDAFEYLGLKAAPAWNDRRRLVRRDVSVVLVCGDLEGILAIRK